MKDRIHLVHSQAHPDPAWPFRARLKPRVAAVLILADLAIWYGLYRLFFT